VGNTLRAFSDTLTEGCLDLEITTRTLLVTGQDSYRLVGLIGGGSSSAVYSAIRLCDRRLVATKLPRQATNHHMNDLLRRETEILRSLQGPGIVKLIDSGDTTDGEAYMVMELLKGDNLEYLMLSGKMSITQVVAIGLKVARIMARAHKLGVVHCDLKPANILISPGSQQVTVLDFGIAGRLCASTGRERPLKRSGSLLYMSPEQLMEEDCCEQSDIYQLGLIMYHCLVGYRPLALSELLLERLEGCLPADLAESAPAPLGRLIKQILNRDPRLRPQSMGIVSRRLQRLGLSEDC
jgi:serine/threonine protein kinase